MDRVRGCARDALAALRHQPRGVCRAAQRLRERDLPGQRPGHRAVRAARAPARLPHRAGDRLRAGLDGRAAGGGRGAHAAGAAAPPTGGGSSPCPRPAARRSGTASGSSSCPGTEPAPSRPMTRLTARLRRLGEITARMHRHARGWCRPAWFTRFHWDYDGGVRRPGALGPLAGRHRGRAGRARDPGPAGRRAARPAARVRLRAGPVRAGARRHPAGQPAGRTTARSASSTSTTPGSAGTCTTWARR